MRDEVAELARRFSYGPQEFTSSPLYRQLCATAAGEPSILAWLTERRPGVQPTNLLMAAIHHSLLQDPGHELAQWFGSVTTGPLRPAETAAAPFLDFCRSREGELRATIRRRLVQTNVPKRTVALRLGLAAVAERIGEPITLVEIGASAGVLLRYDEYGYRIGDRRWGRADSPVQIDTEWRAAGPVPDLDRLPEVTRPIGIDLHPVDVSDPAERAWLRALVWPENSHQARLLTGALDVVAAHPVPIHAGDGATCLPEILDGVPAGSPVVVFHAATLAHVPAPDRPAFTAAIEAVGATHELFHLSLEGFTGSRWKAAFALHLTHGARTREPLATLDG
ncbi:MAG TPA: DUF2332 domain-containing protein, partial [Mycobacteriales bacterium]|nr:DUF2332 domain-containing protein [Mycobacteriales bacterium]